MATLRVRLCFSLCFCRQRRADHPPEQLERASAATITLSFNALLQNRRRRRSVKLGTTSIAVAAFRQLRYVLCPLSLLDRQRADLAFSFCSPPFSPLFAGRRWLLRRRNDGTYHQMSYRRCDLLDSVRRCPDLVRPRFPSSTLKRAHVEAMQHPWSFLLGCDQHLRRFLSSRLRCR